MPGAYAPPKAERRVNLTLSSEMAGRFEALSARVNIAVGTLVREAVKHGAAAVEAQFPEEETT